MGNSKKDNIELDFILDKRSIIEKEIGKLKENFIELDKKIIQMIIFNGILLGYLLESLPLLNTKYIIFSYGIAFTSIIVLLSFLLYFYNPKPYQSVNINDLKNQKITKKGNYKKFNENLLTPLIKEYKSLLNNCKSKSRMIKISYIWLIVNFLLISILKIMEIVNNA